MTARIRHKRGTAAAATSANQILRMGEFGLETDTGKMKIGNGVTAWASLPYTIDRPFTAAEKNKLATYVNVLDYGAVGDGVAYDDDAIQAAHDALPSSGGRVYAPKGTYLLASGLTFSKPIWFCGDGGSTVLRSAFATGDVINMTGQGAKIEGMAIDSAVTRSSGATIIMNNYDQVLEHVAITEAFLGVKIRYTSCSINHSEIRECVPTTGVGIEISNNPLDISLFDILMNGASAISAGVKIIAAGDVEMSKMQLLNCGTCLLVNPGAGQSVASVWASNSFFDTAGRGIDLFANGAGSSIVRANFSQIWAASHTNQGILMRTAGGGVVSGVNMTGLECYLNGADGVSIADSGVSHVNLTGGAIAQNAASGIGINNNVENFTITGVKSGDWGGLTGNLYGVFIGSGCSKYSVHGNNLLGNTTANLSDSGTTPKSVANNLTS